MKDDKIPTAGVGGCKHAARRERQGSKMRKLVVAVLVALSTVVMAQVVHAVCGVCRWDGVMFCAPRNKGWACAVLSPQECWQYPDETCGGGVITGPIGLREYISRWKTQEPTFYGGDISAVTDQWVGRGPIPPALLERYRLKPGQTQSLVGREALRQKTHFDALRILVKAGIVVDPEIVEAVR